MYTAHEPSGLVVLFMLLGVAFMLWVSYYLNKEGKHHSGYTNPHKEPYQQSTTPYVAKDTTAKPRNTWSTGLIAGERDTPPQALFFSCINGEYVEKPGPYEEEFLNSFELSAWKRKQKALKMGFWAPKKSKIPPNPELDAILDAKVAEIKSICQKAKQNQLNWPD
jgi:hypothetical protein